MADDLKKLLDRTWERATRFIHETGHQHNPLFLGVGPAGIHFVEMPWKSDSEKRMALQALATLIIPQQKIYRYAIVSEAWSVEIELPGDSTQHRKTIDDIKPATDPRRVDCLHVIAVEKQPYRNLARAGNITQKGKVRVRRIVSVREMADVDGQLAGLFGSQGHSVN
jgi:hypothetical protein